MPITLTYDFEESTIEDSNDRNRITSAFKRFGWEHIGGSAWRYPALGTDNTSEDWFNHVIPALMYFRSIVEHAGITVHNFTIDAHSEAGHRGRASPPLGEPIAAGADIVLYQVNSNDGALSEARLRRFVTDSADSLK